MSEFCYNCNKKKRRLTNKYNNYYCSDKCQIEDWTKKGWRYNCHHCNKRFISVYDGILFNTCDDCSKKLEEEAKKKYIDSGGNEKCVICNDYLYHILDIHIHHIKYPNKEKNIEEETIKLHSHCHKKLHKSKKIKEQFSHLLQFTEEEKKEYYSKKPKKPKEALIPKWNGPSGIILKW